MVRRLLLLTCSVVAVVGLPVAQVAGPNLVLVDGRVFTGNVASPWAEALAITGDRISAAGPTAEVRAKALPATRVIDLAGRLVVPGFNDAHAHIGELPPGENIEGPSALEHDPTLEELLQRLRVAVAKAPKGRWIYGEFGGAVLDDPKATRVAVDAIAPDHLVMLHAWTGHGALFNTAALRKLGIRDDEPDPPGGFYRRLPGTSTVSGMLHEYAGYRVVQQMARLAGTEGQRSAFRQFAQEAAAPGITSVQVMMTCLPAAEVAPLLADPQLPVRLRLIDFPMTDMRTWRAPSPRTGSSPLVTVSGTKWILDGTPVERLMLLRAPYVDRPTRGAANFNTATLRQFLERARTVGEQPMLHAVGDAAIDQVLDALEKSGGQAWQSLRPRIEHGDLLQPDQFARARRFGVVIVQNPSHLMIPTIMQARVGEGRSARAQALKSTLAAGIPLAVGSDGPMNPFLNLMFANKHAVNPSEAITLEQGVTAYTRGSAFAEHQEHNKGMLAVGMLADLAVLSQDIFRVPVETLPATASVLTIVGGRVVHEK
jgi:predicted amidohydrolase YtcJ